MSILTMNTILTKAVVSDRFRAGLLNGQKAQLLRDFDLEPGELSSLMAIHVPSLKEFAIEVEKIIQAREPRPPIFMREWYDAPNNFIGR